MKPHSGNKENMVAVKTSRITSSEKQNKFKEQVHKK